LTQELQSPDSDAALWPDELRAFVVVVEIDYYALAVSAAQQGRYYAVVVDDAVGCLIRGELDHELDQFAAVMAAVEPVEQFVVVVVVVAVAVAAAAVDVAVDESIEESVE